MDFLTHTAALRNELETYYSDFDSCAEPLRRSLQTQLEAHPEDSSLARKSRMHEILCRECPVKLFRHTPFFF